MTPPVPPAAGRRHPDEIAYELELARQVQQGLLPSSLPQVEGVQVAAVNRPARIVSGDLYDAIIIDPERLAILCADVSGKGFPAALLAAEIQAYVRATLRAACVFNDPTLGPIPLQVVSLLNAQAAARDAAGRYATMFFAEVDASERRLHYVNAGHNPPLLITADGIFAGELTTGGPPVGLLQNATYDAGTLPLPHRSTVLIYTDGVVETRSPDDEEFGLQRLIDLCRAAHDDADALFRHVIDTLDRWRGHLEQDDDITLIAVSMGDRWNFGHPPR
ncbi:MAG TPA: PP2C family protein-serine/threonine phosphatase [Vicinamibacterales bacterium]